MAYDAREFYDFCRALKIDSKEQGIVSLGDNLYGGQLEYLKQIERGFGDGVHEFIVLKSRQLGMTTLSAALDLYWVNKHQAINAALVAHTNKAAAAFRTQLALYRATMPEEWQREVLDDNRDILVLDNGSRLHMLVAGTKAKADGSSTLGRSGALVACHATETAYWGDFSGVDALRASFAQHNPDRFFTWESTANGFNGFKDMWDEAAGAVSKRQIFLSWWSKEHNSFARTHPYYARYWGAKGRLSREEAAITRQVAKDYDFTVDDMSWSWYRWQAAEVITDEMMLMQEHPHLPEHAFIASGRAFFRALDLTAAAKATRRAGGKTYTIATGAQFWDTVVKETQSAKATLTVWAEPVAGAFYALGCDPSYASSESACNNAISVWRVFYNHAEQVAEFADPTMSPYAVGWVVAYLAGYYGNTTVNIEINGPGINVLQALKDLARQAGSGLEGERAASMMKVVTAIRHYVFRKPDTFNGMLQAWHTKTTYEVKERLMNGMRDALERAMLTMRSPRLVAEMQSIVREDGAAPAASGNKADDRVIAAALALMAWNEQMRGPLLARGVLRKPETVEGEAEERTVAENMVQAYFQKIGIVPSDAPPPKKPNCVRGKPAWNPTRSKPKDGIARGVKLDLPQVRGWR